MSFSFHNTPHLALITALGLRPIITDLKEKTILETLRMANMRQWNMLYQKGHCSINKHFKTKQLFPKYDTTKKISHNLNYQIIVPSESAWLESSNTVHTKQNI
jgi:hypothetical protein